MLYNVASYFLDILRLKLITNVYSLHTFGNGAVADGEKRINNDGRNIKLNISNIIKVSTMANAIKNQMDGPMIKFYVDIWITALRGSVVRRVFGTHERIVVFGSEHGEYSNTIYFRFIEYISESSRP